ncbi:hypothetical protein BG006_005147, partial [Podila minutissima]
MSISVTPSLKGSFSLASSSASTPQDLIHKVTLEQQVTSTPPTTSDLNKTPHHNLAVNQKAVMQPVEDQLLEFYNGNNNRFKKHTWDMERAKHIEYQAIANSLLRIVGGSI